MAESEATYRAALAADQAWYTEKRLGGRNGLLWLWGEYVVEDITRLQGDGGGKDDFATLGMQPARGKSPYPAIPADPRILDCGRAFAHLATLPNQPLRWREWDGNTPLPPLTLAQATIYLYFAKRHGERIPADYRNRPSYNKAADRYGVDGRTGCAAVALLLADLPEVKRSVNPEDFIEGRLRWAIGRMSRFLTDKQEQPDENRP